MMKHCLIRKYAGSIALLISSALSFSGAYAETYVVASQNIAYYPHYEFSAVKDRGYAWALLEAFAADRGIKFEYVSMPVLRLQIELEKGNVDFVYPDHPTWTNPVNDNATKHFSAPLTESLVGTFVKPERVGQGISSIRKVSIVLGFSPLYWQEHIDSGQTKLISVADNKSAIYMAQWDRADAFDMDYYVAKYLMQKLDDVDDFKLDPDLPVTVVEFCLSTVKNPELLLELNEFIASNPGLVAMLKARYNIGNARYRLESIRAGLQ